MTYFVYLTYYDPKCIFDIFLGQERDFLLKMSESMDDNRLSRISDIADSLNTTTNKLSRTIAHLIDCGIIAAPEHGKVMFCIPYLADYVKKYSQTSSAIEVARQRRV